MSYRFINGSFGDALGFTVSAVANGRGHGALQIGSRMVRVRSAHLLSWYSNDATGAAWEGTERPGGVDAVRKNHTRFELELFTSDEDGASLKVLGVVTGFMPLRSRRNGGSSD